MVRTRHDTLSSMAVDRRVISCLCVLTESYNLQSLTDTGEISSTAELLSPEERFIADMNDLTDLRKSTHQIYTPTMRRWKVRHNSFSPHVCEKPTMAKMPFFFFILLSSSQIVF